MKNAGLYMGSLRLVLLMWALICLAACTRSQEEALSELQNKQIPFTQEVFLRYVVKGDTEMVKLFLDAGVDPNTMVDVREAGYPTPGSVYQKVPKIPILLVAMERKLPEIEKALISAGADRAIAIESASRYTKAEEVYQQSIAAAVEERLSLPKIPNNPE